MRISDWSSDVCSSDLGQAPMDGARGKPASAQPRIAFMFTGQGSQWVGMGKELYEQDLVFKQAVDRCASVVTPLIGYSLTELMFRELPQGVSLSDTRLAQPALFTLAYALTERLDRKSTRLNSSH